MSKNMNILDRRVRAFLVAPAAILVGILIGPGSIGAIMLATSAVGYCPLYSVFGRGTRASRRSHTEPTGTES
jgi:hypothetical protein